MEQEEECWSLTADDVETVKKSWNTIVSNYILFKQNLYKDVPEKYNDLIIANETKLLTTGSVASLTYLANSLHTNEDKIQTLIYELISHMSFNRLKDIRLITKRWNLSDTEKRKLEFDAEVEHEETINVDTAKRKMREVVDLIEELRRLDKDNHFYHTNKTVLLLSVNETQSVNIKCASEELRAIAVRGGENVSFDWGRDKEDDCLLIKGIQKGNAIITVENNVDTSLLHIFVIVLP